MSTALTVTWILDLPSWKLFGITPFISILDFDALYVKGAGRFSTVTAVPSLSPTPLLLSCAEIFISLGNPSNLVNNTESGAVMLGLILSTISTGIFTVFIKWFPRRISISLCWKPAVEVSTVDPPFQRTVNSLGTAELFETVT